MKSKVIYFTFFFLNVILHIVGDIVNITVYVQITSFVFFCLLCVVFFVKERVRNVETKFYSIFLVVNFLGLIVDICLAIASGFMDLNSVLYKFIARSYLVYFVSWVYLLCVYIYIVSRNKTGVGIFNSFVNSDNKLDKGFFALYLVYLFSLFFVIVAPNYFSRDSYGTHSYGPATSYTFFIAGFFLVLSIILVIFGNFKKNRIKYLPVVVFVVLLVLTMVIQMYNPSLILTPTIMTLVAFIMFFTIENPDMKMMNELEVAKKNAERANFAKTEFLSNMSHEIRTPLNAIVGFSNSIMEDKSLEEAKEEAQDIIMASENLLEIVNGILDISKIEAGKMEIVNVNYNPLNMFNDVCKLIKPRIGEKPIIFKSSFAKDLPGVLYGDNGKVKEIITNLLTNAAKYTDNGEIDFRVSCINEKDICKLVISVEDTGRGIKPEKIDKLFTKFNRLDEDKNTTLEGTGLGLAITKNLVDMMGGKIIVQSKYGEGSKFTVYLSQKIISMVDNTISSDKDEEVVDYSNKKILVVDDNNLNLKVAARLLKKYSIVPDMVISGYDCIDKLKDNKYDLILMDDMMPKLSGVDTFKKLKEDKDFKTPVVILTANAISGMREKYLKIGFDDYLAKPIENDELGRILKKFLKKK